MHPAVTDALQRAFPGRQVAGTDPLPDSNHPGNQTVRVTFADGDVAYCKVRTDGDAERNARETATIQYVGAHGDVRVPRVLAADSAGDPPYLATARLPGTPLEGDWAAAEADARAALAPVVGRAVAGVASATVDRPGWITGGDADRLDVETGSWSAVLADAVSRWAEEVPFPDRFADVPDRVADLLADRAGALDGAPAAVVHGDAHPSNLLVDGTPGLLDWERALVGDPGLGLAWAEAWHVERADVSGTDRDRLREAIRAGYREAAGGLPLGFDARLPVYRVIAFLPKVQTFDAWADGAAEDVAALAAWIGDELDERIDAARDGA